MLWVALRSHSALLADSSRPVCVRNTLSQRWVQWAYLFSFHNLVHLFDHGSAAVARLSRNTLLGCKFSRVLVDINTMSSTEVLQMEWPLCLVRVWCVQWSFLIQIIRLYRLPNTVVMKQVWFRHRTEFWWVFERVLDVVGGCRWLWEVAKMIANYAWICGAYYSSCIIIANVLDGTPSWIATLPSPRTGTRLVEFVTQFTLNKVTAERVPW